MPVPPEAGRDGRTRKCQEVRRQIGKHCLRDMSSGIWNTD